MANANTQFSNEELDSMNWNEIVRDVREEYLAETQHLPWIIGFSGGKDSTVVAHAVFEALMSIPPSRRTRAVHIVSNA